MCEGEAAPGAYSTVTAINDLPGTLGNACSKFGVTTSTFIVCEGWRRNGKGNGGEIQRRRQIVCSYERLLLIVRSPPLLTFL